MGENQEREQQKRNVKKTKKSPGGIFKGLIWLIGMIISPFVVFIKLFKVGEPIPRKWLISLSVLLFLCVGVTWTASSLVDGLSNESIAILADYNQARIDVRKGPYAESVNYISLQYDMDPSLVCAIMSQLSGYQSELTSFRGNKGLMQISPDVWRVFNPYAACQGDHPAPQCSDVCIFDVNSNIHTGVAYLQHMIDMYDGDIPEAVAAYTYGVAPEYIPVHEDGTIEIDDDFSDNIDEIDTSEEEEIIYEGYVPPAVSTDVGYTPSILQSFINTRSETLWDRIALLILTKKIRMIASIVTVVIAMILMCAIIFKYHPQKKNRRDEDEGSYV